MSAPSPKVYQDENGKWCRADGRYASWMDMAEAGYHLRARRITSREEPQPGDTVYFNHAGGIVRLERAEWVKDA